VTELSREEIDAQYERAYQEHPLDEPDEWGDLASWSRAAAATVSARPVNLLGPGECLTSGPGDIAAWVDGRTYVAAAHRVTITDADGDPADIAASLSVTISSEQTDVELEYFASDWDRRGLDSLGSGGVVLAGRAIGPLDEGDSDEGGVIRDRGSHGIAQERLGGQVVVASGRLLAPATWIRFGQSERRLPETASEQHIFCICTLAGPGVVHGEASNGWTFRVTVTPW
jgi:hypothetical protein